MSTVVEIFWAVFGMIVCLVVYGLIKWAGDQ